jgi:hypothetical protein
MACMAPLAHARSYDVGNHVTPIVVATSVSEWSVPDDVLFIEVIILQQYFREIAHGARPHR